MGYRWRGFEHPELYKMINTGPGAHASDPQIQYWKTLSTVLAEVDQDLNAKLTQLGSRWEGKASESAQSGLTPLAEWASDAETGSDVMRISAENQGEYISDARAKMPEPVEVTTQAPSGWDKFVAGAALATGNAGPAVDVAAQSADHEAQEAAQSEAEQRAIETMTTYESSATWNRETLGTFVAPPDVVVATPTPQGSGTANAVIIGSTTRSVNPNDNGSGSGTGKKPPTVHQQPTSTTPQVNPGGSGTLTPGTGTLPGGNVPATPGTVLPGASTTPSTFTPPSTLPNNQFPFPTNPSPGPNPNPYPGQQYFPGTGPVLPGQNGDNASDIARRALPLRPGLPGMPGGLPGETGPFGRPGGPAGGPGGFPAGAVDGERMPSQLGRGGAIGAGVPGEGGVVRNGPGAAGAAGGRGAGGANGPMGAGGRRGEGEDDDEHYSPDYLLETDDVFGDDRRVAPTVIGE